MTGFDLYVFVLCMIVFVLLTGLFTTMIVIISKQSLRLIRSGVEDARIYDEYIKEQKKKKSKAGAVIDAVISVVFCAVFLLLLSFSIYTKIIADDVTGNIPTVRVVQSDSMEKKYEGNKYLFENGLDDQFSMFDLVLTHKLPDEFDLQLYDIVVYEVDDTLIIHRIVAIEEPNEKHPNERYFRLQGDNVHISDRFPVKYSQMKGIYRGQSVPYVGSFILFMQSPAGIICALLIIFAMIAAPIVDGKIEKEKKKRIRLLGQTRANAKAPLLANQRVLPDGGIFGAPTTGIPIPVPTPVPYTLQIPVCVPCGTPSGDCAPPQNAAEVKKRG